MAASATPWFVWPIGAVLLVGFGIFYTWIAKRSARRTRALVAAPYLRLGLQPVVQTTWRNCYQGIYGGFAMELDSAMSRAKHRELLELDARGSQVTKAGMKIDLGHMFLRATVTLPRPAAGSLEIVREPDDGLWELGAGLYGRFEPAAGAALEVTGVLAALAAARFDRIAASGTRLELAWAIGMMALINEAQSRPAAEHEAALKAQVDAVAALAAALVGPT